MTYTIKETITKQLKPSEVYTASDAEENIKALLAKGWRIVGFRPPTNGEIYIMTTNGREVDVHPGFYCAQSHHGVRFIVTKQQALPEWE